MSDRCASRWSTASGVAAKSPWPISEDMLREASAFEMPLNRQMSRAVSHSGALFARNTSTSLSPGVSEKPCIELALKLL